MNPLRMDLNPPPNRRDRRAVRAFARQRPRPAAPSRHAVEINLVAFAVGHPFCVLVVAAAVDPESFQYVDLRAMFAALVRLVRRGAAVTFDAVVAEYGGAEEEAPGALDNWRRAVEAYRQLPDPERELARLLDEFNTPHH